MISTDLARETRNNRISWLLFAILGVAILSVLPSSGWHSSWAVDSRTQVEMIRGISDHGLPYMFNGPSDLYPELQARWNIARGDQLWGLYPPLFAYVSVPFFKVWGLAGVSRMNILFVLLFAGGAFALARRFLRDPLLAIAATYVAVLSTPVGATAMDISPFILAEAAIVWTIYVALLSLQSARFSGLLASGAGILGGCSISSHLITFPMVAGVIVALAQPEEDSERERFAGSPFAILETWLPTRTSLRRAGAMTLALAVSLVPMALLNHARFGSYNPISYGPCVWASCAWTGIDQQSAGMMLRYAMPSVIWVTATTIALWHLRKDTLGLWVVAIVSLAAFFSSAALVAHAWQIAKIAWAYVVDMTTLHIPEYQRAADKIGYFLGPFVVRSALQCTPILVLAPFVRLPTLRDRRQSILLLLPSIMLLGICALRANEPVAYALGFPCLYLRYTVPALAPVLIVAMASAKSLPWRRGHALFIALASVALFLILFTKNDNSLWRRVLLLYGTLLVAAATAFTFWKARRSATERDRARAANVAALAIALGIGTMVGVTFPALQGFRDDDDMFVDTISSQIPQRFAIIGDPSGLDTLLALRATRDVEYIDLYEVRPATGLTNVRKMIDVWTDEGRPIFELRPDDRKTESPWPDVTFEELDSKERLFRVRKH